MRACDCRDPPRAYMHETNLRVPAGYFPTGLRGFHPISDALSRAYSWMLDCWGARTALSTRYLRRLSMQIVMAPPERGVVAGGPGDRSGRGRSGECTKERRH